MFKKMEEASQGDCLAYQVIGDVTQEDYQVIEADMDALLATHDEMRLLLDMTQFRWEKVNAWDDDLRFGRKYHHVIKRLAIVGDKKWQSWLAKLSKPFFAQDARFFHPDEMDKALDWLRDDGQ